VAIGKAISILVFALVVVFILFEVNFVLDLGGSQELEVPDPEVEAAYDACYREKDDEIHKTAFGTIDNPDVQREFITSSRARAAAECRQEHPERTITVEMSSSFNLVDLEPRFW
jgi:hypothetical protein